MWPSNGWVYTATIGVQFDPKILFMITLLNYVLTYGITMSWYALNDSKYLRKIDNLFHYHFFSSFFFSGKLLSLRESLISTFRAFLLFTYDHVRNAKVEKHESFFFHSEKISEKSRRFSFDFAVFRSFFLFYYLWNAKIWKTRIIFVALGKKFGKVTIKKNRFCSFSKWIFGRLIIFSIFESLDE